MKKYQLLSFAVLAFILVACNTNSPTKPYEGTWSVMEGQTYPYIYGDDTLGHFAYSTYYKTIVISSNKMIATRRSDANIRHEYHYRVLRDSIIELERTYLQSPERPDYKLETRMYFDENHHLIIEKFCEAEHNMTQVLPPPYYSVMLERK